MIYRIHFYLFLILIIFYVYVFLLTYYKEKIYRSTNFSIKMYYLFQVFLTSVRISNFFRSWISSSNYAYSASAKPRPSVESIYIKSSSPPAQLMLTLTFYSVTFYCYFLLFTATFYFSLLLLLLAIIFVYLLLVLTYFGKIFYPPTLLCLHFNHNHFSPICRNTPQHLFHRHPEKICASWLTISRANF